jgi:hypothetical protein
VETIWKYDVLFGDEFILDMPAGATVLSANYDPHGQLCMWAIVDPTADPEKRTFCLRGTGNPLMRPRDSLRFIATVRQGPFMWHLFELIRDGIRSNHAGD